MYENFQSASRIYSIMFCMYHMRYVICQPTTNQPTDIHESHVLNEIQIFMFHNNDAMKYLQNFLCLYSDLDKVVILT